MITSVVSAQELTVRAPTKKISNFKLAIDRDYENIPCKVDKGEISGDQKSWEPPTEKLKVLEKGKFQVKVYCSSDSVMGGLIVLVDGLTECSRVDSRLEEITETIEFSGDSNRSVSYAFGEQPLEISIEGATIFYNDSGVIVEQPYWDSTVKRFRSTGKIYGKLLVKYNCNTEIYSVEYGNGSEILSETAFQRIKDVWSSEDPKENVMYPPVIVIAKNSSFYAAIEEERLFSPHTLSPRAIRRLELNSDDEKKYYIKYKAWFEENHTSDSEDYAVIIGTREYTEVDEKTGKKTTRTVKYDHISEDDIIADYLTIDEL